MNRGFNPQTGAAGALACIIAIAATLPVWIPARAQTLDKPECSAANIESANEKVLKMPESKMKVTALNEIKTARDLLAQGNSEECKSHLLKATLQTK